MLPLSDPRWKELRGGYRVAYDASVTLSRSEALNTSPEIWMGLQADFDLWHALRKRADQKSRGAKARGKHRAA